MIGKAIRLERIINRATGNSIIVPMDHGISMGPIYGITDMKQAVDRCVEGGADAVLVHKGIVRSGHRGSGGDVGLIIHMSGSTSFSPSPNHKVMTCTVEEAIRLGADAVSVHVNLGDEREPDMLADLARVTDAASKWGMPVLAMMYPRGEKISDPYDKDALAHAARIGAELGADLIKVNYSGSVEGFRNVIKGCPVPVLIAGGEKMETDEELLQMVCDAMRAGARGVSIGRNVFQHQDPAGMLGALAAIVHGGKSVNDAKAGLKTQGSGDRKKRK